MEPNFRSMIPLRRAIIAGCATIFLLLVVTVWENVQQVEELPEEFPVNTPPSDWTYKFQTGQVKMDDPRRPLYILNQNHPAFMMDHVMSAETQSLHRFICEVTSMDEETVWILLQGCREQRLSLWVVLALIDQETGGTFQADLVGRDRDRGYMQITPITERHLFQIHGSNWHFEYNPEDIFEPWYNLTLGMRYLRELADRQMELDWPRVLSEYNYGPVGLSRYHRRNGTYETGYSRRVMEKSLKWEKAYLESNGEYD